MLFLSLTVILIIIILFSWGGVRINIINKFLMFFVSILIGTLVAFVFPGSSTAYHLTNIFLNARSYYEPINIGKVIVEPKAITIHNIVLDKNGIFNFQLRHTGHFSSNIEDIELVCSVELSIDDKKTIVEPQIITVDRTIINRDRLNTYIFTLNPRIESKNIFRDTELSLELMFTDSTALYGEIFDLVLAPETL